MPINSSGWTDPRGIYVVSSFGIIDSSTVLAGEVTAVKGERTAVE
jgi:hypothetical protein